MIATILAIILLVKIGTAIGSLTRARAHLRAGNEGFVVGYVDRDCAGRTAAAGEYAHEHSPCCRV